MSAYKFSNTATDTKPNTETTRLLEKAMSGSVLSRKEKDKVAEALYGLFGAQGPTYELHGWAWPMRIHLARTLVSFSYEPMLFHIYYAPDKTSLRKCLVDKHYILEMIYA